MSNSYKRTVALTDIVPGDNPRRDFGDLDALAGAIAATGGQPVNPPVVVQDGNRYRLVDGERRWRALKRLHGETGMADVLVFMDFGEAEQAVAMMATDAKQGLTDEEKARGFQRMLLLGVEEHTVAKAARRKVGDIRKARQVAADAPEQATLDQMICAAGFEDERDRAAVLKAAPDKWAAKAETIRRRNQKAEERQAFMDCILGLGFDPEGEQPKGYSHLTTCYTPAELEREVAAHEDEELAVWPASWGDYWVLGHKTPERVETEEERAARETEERRRGALEDFRAALAKEIATTDVMPRTQEAGGRLRAKGYNYQRDQLRKDLAESGVREDVADRFIESPMSMYELVSLVRQNSLFWWQWVCALYPAAVDDGFQPSESDAWLHELAQDGRSAWERKKAEEIASEAEAEQIEEYEDEDEDIEF